MSNWYQSMDGRAVQRALRRQLGRSGTTYEQYDATARRMRNVGVCRDPIYDLYVARLARYLHPAHYGEVRQRVVSPVALPDRGN